MRTLQEKYNAVLEGNFSKEQFRRDAAMQLPNLVSKFNSFEDMSTILKNRGMITEAKKMQEPKYSTAKPEDAIAPDVLDTGIKFELDKKYGTLDVTDEQYAKCREMAIKNLAKDVLYYVKQDSIQLEAPGEKMEKVKLNEGSSQPKYSEEELAQFTKDQIEHDEETYRRETSEEIQNIESDEQTKKRIAGLTNQLLRSADPRDEYVKAYAISVKNDLESGDSSRMSQYKDILSLDDLKHDMEQYLSNDVEDAVDESFETLNEGIIDAIKDKLVAAGNKISKMFSPEETAKMKDAVEKALGKPATEIGLSDLTIANAKKVGPLVKDFLLKEEQSLDEGRERYNTRWDDEDYRIEMANWEAWLKQLQSYRTNPEKAQSMYDELTPEEKQYIIDDYKKSMDVKRAGVHDAIQAFSAKSDKKAARKSLTGKLGGVLTVLGMGAATLGSSAALVSTGAGAAVLGGLVAIIVGGIMIAQGPNDPLPNDTIAEKSASLKEDQVEEGKSIELSAEDMEKLHKDGKITLPDGSVLHFVGKPANEEDEYQAYKDGVTQDSIDMAMKQAGMKEAQLKETIKKIIAKVITE